MTYLSDWNSELLNVLIQLLGDPAIQIPVRNRNYLGVFRVKANGSISIPIPFIGIIYVLNTSAATSEIIYRDWGEAPVVLIRA